MFSSKERFNVWRIRFKGSFGSLSRTKTQARNVVGFNFEDSCVVMWRIFYDETSHTSLKAMEDSLVGTLSKEHTCTSLTIASPLPA